MVISEATGATVAVTYDVKDVDLVAAAPDFLEAAEDIKRESAPFLYADASMLVPYEAYYKLMDALNKAKGL